MRIEYEDQQIVVAPTQHVRRYVHDLVTDVRGYSGERTFRDLMFMLFGTELHEIAIAKLNLICSDEYAKYSRTRVFRSFLQYAKASALTSHEFVTYVYKLQSRATSQAVCICKEVLPHTTHWKYHECRLQIWMLEAALTKREGQSVSPNPHFEWEVLITRYDDYGAPACLELTSASTTSLSGSSGI
ncbi:unnamed protein product [Acanthoscelides obtectus]|uniref:Uncharacterized protein n=1 Tax=Acanthoscelides obtectus TaxID=200917 RepID=A0A9P0M0Y0_ACAOB|nr:unnamed protein product [Acanthoscelides obtectus]CAK1654766.1 hypothetical protein AOBTE_LOCUS18827 [Acanthoscelides obtectus]